METQMKKLARSVISMALVPFLFAIAAISAAMAATPLVDAAWLEKRLGDDEVVPIDLRNKINGGSCKSYLEGHML